MLSFDGTWAIDTASSVVWDPATRSYVPDEVGEEIITIRTDGNVQDYEVLYGDDPVIRMGYTAAFDDSAWTPYVVRGITPKADGAEVAAAVAEFTKRVRADKGPNARRFEPGKPYGMIRLAWVDDRTHYRIQRTEKGQAQNVMMRRLSLDAATYTSTLLDCDGVVYRIRIFARVT